MAIDIMIYLFERVATVALTLCCRHSQLVCILKFLNFILKNRFAAKTTTEIASLWSHTSCHGIGQSYGFVSLHTTH